MTLLCLLHLTHFFASEKKKKRGKKPTQAKELIFFTFFSLVETIINFSSMLFSRASKPFNYGSLLVSCSLPFPLLRMSRRLCQKHAEEKAFMQDFMQPLIKPTSPSSTFITSAGRPRGLFLSAFRKQ